MFSKKFFWQQMQGFDWFNRPRRLLQSLFFLGFRVDDSGSFCFAKESPVKLGVATSGAQKDGGGGGGNGFQRARKRRMVLMSECFHLLLTFEKCETFAPWWESKSF